MHTPAPIIDTRGIAAVCGVSRRAVSLAASEGAIPAPVHVGRSHVWLRDQLPGIAEAMRRRNARQCNRREAVA